MKHFILFIFLICFVCISHAQALLPVEEALRPMSKGTNPSFAVEIPKTTLKDVEKEWIKYIRAGSKEKPVESGGEIAMPGAVNKNVAASTFKIYSALLEITDGVRLTAWFSIGNDSVFISREMGNGRDLAAQKYVRDFALARYRDAMKNEVQAEKNKLKKLDSELKDLVKQEEKAVKNINEMQRTIGRTQDAIGTLRGDEQRKSDQIYNQKTVLEGMNNKADQSYKDAEKVLKNLEKEKEKAQKQNEKENKSIDNLNRDIREERRKIDDLKQDQRLKRGQIEDQKRAVSQAENRLKQIK